MSLPSELFLRRSMLDDLEISEWCGVRLDLIAVFFLFSHLDGMGKGKKDGPELAQTSKMMCFDRFIGGATIRGKASSYDAERGSGMGSSFQGCSGVRAGKSKTTGGSGACRCPRLTTT